jgi:hypothetical protein
MPFHVRFLVLASPAFLMLSACGTGAAPPAGKAAGAKVLPGTISDAMIDLDQSQSHPLLNPDQRIHKTAGEIMGDDASDASDDPAAADDAKPVPTVAAPAE